MKPRFFSGIRNWLRQRRLQRDARLTASHLAKQADMLHAGVEAVRSEINRLQDRLNEYESEVGSYQKVLIKNEQEIDRLRAENQVYSEVTIPGLTEHNELLLDRIRADRAIETRRQMVNGQ